MYLFQICATIGFKPMPRGSQSAGSADRRLVSHAVYRDRIGVQIVRLELAAGIGDLNYAGAQKSRRDRAVIRADVGEAAAFVVDEEVRLAAQILRQQHAAERAAEAVAMVLEGSGV